MPAEGIKVKPARQIMTYEEILSLAKAAIAEGIDRIRLTGGEPLVRRDIVDLIASLKKIEGLADISMTTNGILLEKNIEDLWQAGLRRVNISIDTLDAEKYAQVTRWGSLDKALAGMRAALRIGMNPVKINVVVLKGLNDDFSPFAKLVYEYPVHVRFIEYMPAFYGDQAERFVSGKELLARIQSFGKLHETDSPGGVGPARYFKPRGAKGTLGIIGSSKGHFCESCNRLRLTADGKLRTCLFSDQEIDLLTHLRKGANHSRLRQIIRKAINLKPKDRFAKREGKIRRSMSQIGG
jgi:cyclic pyranopterin phosphate synthase